MSKFEKLIKKFSRTPIPNDITYDEVKKLAGYFKCDVKGGGKHIHVVHSETGTVIPIPRHGKCVGEAYIKQLKELFDSIDKEGLL